MVVAEVMTEDPLYAEPTWTVRRVLGSMYENDFRHFPVVDGGNLVGMVSDRDLREQVLLPAMMRFDDPAGSEDLLEQAISEVMSGDVLSVNPETELADVIDLMVEHKIGALPVVRVATSELAGIVSYIDVLKALRDAV